MYPSEEIVLESLVLSITLIKVLLLPPQDSEYPKKNIYEAHTIQIHPAAGSWTIGGYYRQWADEEAQVLDNF